MENERLWYKIPINTKFIEKFDGFINPVKVESNKTIMELAKEFLKVNIDINQLWVGVEQIGAGENPPIEVPFFIVSTRNIHQGWAFAYNKQLAALLLIKYSGLARIVKEALNVVVTDIYSEYIYVDEALHDIMWDFLHGYMSELYWSHPEKQTLIEKTLLSGSGNSYLFSFDTKKALKSAQKKLNLLTMYEQEVDLMRKEGDKAMEESNPKLKEFRESFDASLANKEGSPEAKEYETGVMCNKNN